MDSNKKENEHPIFGEVISVYTQDEAIEDGVLVHVGDVGKQRVVLSRVLFDQGYEDEAKRKALIEKGLELLCQQDPEDSPDMRLRVIEKGKIWSSGTLGKALLSLHRKTIKFNALEGARAIVSRPLSIRKRLFVFKCFTKTKAALKCIIQG